MKAEGDSSEAEIHQESSSNYLTANSAAASPNANPNGNSALTIQRQEAETTIDSSDRHLLNYSSDATGEQTNAPELEEYKGQAINQNGAISSPTSDYEAVNGEGVRIRKTPASSPDNELGRLRYNSKIHIKCKNKSDTGWVFVMSHEGLAGWVNASYVAFPIPEPSASLYHVKAYPDCYKDIFAFYKNQGYSPEIGKDDRHILMGLAIANSGREGVTIDSAKFNESFSNNKLTNIFDNQDENRAVYQAIQLTAGLNIWLPSWGHIESLMESGAIAARPDWMNAGIEVGKGVVAFTDGLLSGFFGGIWDSLVGLWDIGSEIIGTIGKIVTGEIVQDIEKVFDFVKGLTVDKAQQIVQSLVKAIVAGVGDFVNNWNNPNFYNKWEFRGRIIGSVLLEVLLAIFTGGIGNAAKWIGKLGKYAPKLARIIRKIIDKVEDVIPDRMKRRDGDTDAEGMDFEKQQALLLAKAITDTHDAKDSSLPVLKASLAVVKQKYNVVKRFDVDAIPGRPGHYTVTMIASKHTVDSDYTPGKESKDRRAEMDEWRDPATGKPFRSHELEGALDFEQSSNRTLKPTSTSKGDFEDVASGKILDHFGMGAAFEHIPRPMAVQQFKKSVDSHVAKLSDGVDELILDFKNFNSSEIADVKKYISDNHGSYQSAINIINE